MHEITVTVNPDGTTVADFSGFIGPSCLAEAERLRELLAALGVHSAVLHVQPKPEMDVSQAQSDQQSGRATHQQESTQ